MTNIEFMWSGEGYWTPAYGVYRWSDLMVTRPGTYAVIAHSMALALARMGCEDSYAFSHPTCVVDDFGDLVKVPS